MELYLIEVEGGIEPTLHGPYTSEDTRNREARTIREGQDNEYSDDVIFWLDVAADGKPTIGTYSGAFFEKEEPDTA